MKYDGILFDLDGTLWDSTEAVAASWEIACGANRMWRRLPPESSWKA